MNKHLKWRVVLSAFTMALMLNTAQATPVVLTVKPAVISNTYPGVITLDITGLTNTEKVTIQKWIDSDGNGAVDAGELMMDAGKISDGGAMIIGGITNVSVPYDNNPTNGEITTTLSVPPGMAVENMVAKYVFRVVSQTGRFAPVTAPFEITNAALNQSVSG